VKRRRPWCVGTASFPHSQTSLVSTSLCVQEVFQPQHDGEYLQRRALEVQFEPWALRTSMNWSLRLRTTHDGRLTTHDSRLTRVTRFALCSLSAVRQLREGPQRGVDPAHRLSQGRLESRWWEVWRNIVLRVPVQARYNHQGQPVFESGGDLGVRREAGPEL